VKSSHLLAVKRNGHVRITASVQGNNAHKPAKLLNVSILFDFDNATRVIYKTPASGINNSEENTV
jgi:hypothetical protein